MEKENNNALQTLNVKQLDEILRELEVRGRSTFRRKQDKIDRILKEVSDINEYLIRYKKQSIRTKDKTQKPHEAIDIEVPNKLSERQKKRRTKINPNSIKKEIRLKKKSKDWNQREKMY